MSVKRGKESCSTHYTGKQEVRPVADADVMDLVCRVAPNLRVQPSVRIGEVDRNWQSLVRCEEMREMIFCLLNPGVIRDEGQMVRLGWLASRQTDSATL